MDSFANAFAGAVAWLDAVVAWVLIPGLLGTGLLLTARLGFIQVRRLGHGVRVTLGRYDDAEHPGDVSHFAALSTALSATVGVGNIAGVALAINAGGPGALFWMWVTAFLGMAVKYAECTLALRYRHELAPHGMGVGAGAASGSKALGAVSGGPMYYMERALGMKPLAIFFAAALLTTSFFTGNAVQANTVADVFNASFGVPVWVTGLVSASLVAAVILGGIRRIGRITSILAPSMAILYVLGGVTILILNWRAVFPALGTVFSQAFSPVASATGVGAGSVLTVMTMGVKRGLFSNEAGQGSAPIAHAAARTKEPVSEGVVALLEPFIDTILICTLTGLVLLTTQTWDARFPTKIALSAGTWSAPTVDVEDGKLPAQALRINGGWVDSLYLDEALERPFSGSIQAGEGGAAVAVAMRGGRQTVHTHLYGEAVEMGAPLTAKAFSRGLAPLVNWGDLIVTLCVALFALSTAISWSYYGDRCAMYLMGPKAVLPYRIVFCGMHVVGATVALTSIWGIGDLALSFATLPNILALVLLSGSVKKLTDSYFERQPWKANRGRG